MIRAKVCWVHAAGMLCTIQLSTPNNDMVQLLPGVRPWMHPGYFEVEGASKEGVSKCKVAVGAEFKMPLTIIIHFTQAMRSERTIPLIAVRSNLNVKVSDKNQIIAFGNGREWLTEKLIELILFLAAHHNVEASWVLNACHQAVMDSNANSMLHPFALRMSTPEEGAVLFANGSTTRKPGFTKGWDVCVYSIQLKVNNVGFPGCSSTFVCLDSQVSNIPTGNS